MTPAAALHAGLPEVLVGRAPPHVIVAATPAFLETSGFSETDLVGRSCACMQGSGTCQVTLGALWTALQARAPLPPRPGQNPRSHRAPRLSDSRSHKPLLADLRTRPPSEVSS